MHILFRSVAVALLVCTSALAAGDEGARKSGEWEITVTVSGQSPYASKVCLDSASDDVAAAAGGGVAQSGCEQTRTEHNEQGFAIHSVCKQGNSTVTSTGMLSGDLDSGYQGEVVKNYSPPLYGRTEVKSTVAARYVGDCP